MAGQGPESYGSRIPRAGAAGGRSAGDIFLWRAFVRAGETSYPSLYTKEEEVEGFSMEKDEICQLRRCCVKKVHKNQYFTTLNGQSDKEVPENAQI